ncbi:hypothetical protein BGZ49_007554 [Haplosporangium sp. Z 27]|nr:hypothetical protein BGZ49_007554 [Haplosporangium sp. Z 27]
MVQARRFHSNFLFCIPLTQGVLLTIILEFCKNAAFFAHQVQNMNPNSIAIIGNGEQVEKPKDPAYMAAQYIYGIWMITMMINAIIGFRANLKFNLRWMSIFNILFGIDTGFEFIHTTLGVIFQDTSQLNDSAIIQTYCLSYVILMIQLYGFFCCWMHLRWIHAEMPQLLTAPRETFFQMMVPIALRRSRGNSTTISAEVTTTAAVDPEVADIITMEEGAGTSMVLEEVSSAVPRTEPVPRTPSLGSLSSSAVNSLGVANSVKQDPLSLPDQTSQMLSEEESSFASAGAAPTLDNSRKTKSEIL